MTELANHPALGHVRIKNLNSAQLLVAIARLTLGADIALFEGRADAAVDALSEATAIEDAMAYDEPHLWLAPTRHALGAALIAAGRPTAAERVYRDDLKRYPDTGWSLAGLAEALRRQGASSRPLRSKRGDAPRGAMPTSSQQARASSFDARSATQPMDLHRDGEIGIQCLPDV